jgi:phosphotransferase system enzyme I (PtsI)
LKTAVVFYAAAAVIMKLSGEAVSSGFTSGRIHIYIKNQINVTEKFISPKEMKTRIDRYNAVKGEAIEELEKTKLFLEKHSPEKSKIFSAHQDIVNDIIINEEIITRIANDHWAEDWAVFKVYENSISLVRKTGNSEIAMRSVDFEDVRDLLLRLMYGIKNDNFFNLSQSVIIAAHDLLPSDTASMDRNKVLALLTETGGSTSHTAIIAKSYGIPAVLGIPDLLNTVHEGQFAAVDAEKGEIILDPDNAAIEFFKKKQERFIHAKAEDEKYRKARALTADGVKIDIGINISKVSQDELDGSVYCDQAGLFRTEFLYMGKDSLPDEEEQFAVYKKVLQCFGNKPVILRTLDIGGDKRLSAMELPHEGNPFLGNRAIRLCFSNPEIFRTQIRACLRASVFGDLWIMLPMISSLEDIRKAKDFIFSFRGELLEEGQSVGDFKIGIMLEVPSIALAADLAAQETDFASIGSNDLCQYLCAADRINSSVAAYYQSFHPAMWRLIRDCVYAFNSAGKPVSICGELASDSLAIPVLLGLGLRKFSMGVSSVARVKHLLSTLNIEDSEKITNKVLKCKSASEIREFLQKNIRH